MKKMLPISILLLSITLAVIVSIQFITPPEKLMIGQTIIIDENISITVSDIILTTSRDVPSDNNGSGLTITIGPGPIDDDKIYVRIEIRVWNKSHLTIPSQWIRSEVEYDGSYDYYQAFIEGTPVEKLSSGKYYIFFEIPVEARYNHKSIVVSINMLGKKYIIDWR